MNPSQHEPKPVTHDSLARLYRAAVAFRDLAPWQRMENDQVFGVQNPTSGDVGYCTVLGALGTVFALAVYPGARGFYCFHRLAVGERDPGDFETAATQDCLLASFEARADLNPRDRREIAALGLKFRGGNAWPLFRSARPGYAPWYVESAEVTLLTVALEQAHDVCVQIRDGVVPSPTDFERPLRVRQWDPARNLWLDTWQAPPEEPVRDAPPQPPAAHIQRVLRATKRAPFTVEAALVHLPTIIQERDQRPFWPRVWFQADATTGIVGLGELMDPGRSAADLQGAFLATLERGSLIPAEIRTADDESLALLTPTAQALGVRLRHVESTPALDAARDAFAEAFRRREGLARNELLD